MQRTARSHYAPRFLLLAVGAFIPLAAPSPGRAARITQLYEGTVGVQYAERPPGPYPAGTRIFLELSYNPDAPIGFDAQGVPDLWGASVALWREGSSPPAPRGGYFWPTSYGPQGQYLSALWEPGQLSIWFSWSGPPGTFTPGTLPDADTLRQRSISIWYLNDIGGVEFRASLTPVAPAPEPATLASAAVGLTLAGLAWRRRRLRPAPVS